MNIIDSSFWLEYFADTKAGDIVSDVIKDTNELSLSAAKIGKNHKLPMADSIIYATNLKYNCILWTQDRHGGRGPAPGRPSGVFSVMPLQ
jgi:predicted nucleic acid-binding protein